MSDRRSGRRGRRGDARHRRSRGRGRLRGYSLGLSWRRSLDLNRSRRLCNGFLPIVGAEVRPHLFSLVVIQRARMRLLVFDAQAGQAIDDRLALYFQLARQIVNSNLTHSLLLRLPRFSTKQKSESRK